MPQKQEWIFVESGEVVECETHAEALARFIDLYAWSDLKPVGGEVILLEEYYRRVNGQQ